MKKTVFILSIFMTTAVFTNVIAAERCTVSIQNESRKNIKKLWGQTVNGYTIVRKNADLKLSIKIGSGILENGKLCDSRRDGALKGGGHVILGSSIKAQIESVSGYKHSIDSFCSGNWAPIPVTHPDNIKVFDLMASAKSRTEYESLQNQLRPELNYIVPPAGNVYLRALEKFPPCENI